MSALVSVPRLAHMLFDPRGRVDRKGLLILALAMLALQGLFGYALVAGWIGLDSPVTIAIKMVFLWVAVVAASKRLHDAGLSAWWIAATLLVVVVWSAMSVGVMIVVYGDQILIPGSAGYVGTLTLNMLPILAATLWLHFAKGNSGANAYGPPPDATGFSPPPPGQRRVAGAATRSGASPAITA